MNDTLSMTIALIMTAVAFIFGIFVGRKWGGSRAEKELDELRVSQVRTAKFSALGEMAAGIAHEINSPLSTIRSRAVQLLRIVKEGELNKEDLTRLLEIIVKTSDRIGRIISGLQTFSRNADGDPFIPVRVGEVIDDTLSLCNEKLKSRGVPIEIFGFTDIMVTCRPTQLTQVLLNLVLNSCDAVADRSEKWIRIEVVSMPESMLAIRVVDSGKGIAADVVEKLMQPFFTTKEFGKGTGLGLSISKGIVEDHGGILRYERDCSNTTFTVLLPYGEKAKALGSGQSLKGATV